MQSTDSDNQTIKTSPGNKFQGFFWACPVCHSPLAQKDKTWCCDSNHSFDQAKEGYINLLLANQKSSKSPGDSSDMLIARREFLESGYYQPIADAIASVINIFSGSKTVAENSSEHEQPFSILDCGCGEGYYLNQISKKIKHPLSMAGLDIAKSAVKLAAKRYPQIEWVCASSLRLPIMDNSLDILLRVFAPSNDFEVGRVLKDDGLFVVVTPGENHLIEIKQALYDDIKPYAIPVTPESFCHHNESENDFVKTITYVLSLNNNYDIKKLMSMTPFFWRGKREGREELLKQDSLTVTVDVNIRCYVKNSAQVKI